VSDTETHTEASHTTRVERARVWLRQPGNRSLVIALVVAFVLRLAWAIWATKATTAPQSDPGRYVTTAEQLADFRLPYRGDSYSAANAIGYPALLAPFFWLSERLGTPSPVFTASLLNVAIGTATVAFGAKLASVWFSLKARNVAAWLLAIGPGQIYFTSAAMTETLYAALVVGGLLAGSLLVMRARDEVPRKRWAGAFGLLVGYATLVNPGGLLLLLVPTLTRRVLRGSWKGAFARLGMILAGAAVLLLPWAVRNGVQVGVWSPGATSTGPQMCLGHWPEADGTQAADIDGFVRCYSGQPVQPGQTAEEAQEEWLASVPDEREVYERSSRAAVKYAVTHPIDELRLTALRMWVTMRTDDGALRSAADNGNHELAGPEVYRLLLVIGDAWYFFVMITAALALVFVRRCRRAVPIWGIALLLLIGINVSHGSPRYHHSIVAVAAVLASSAIAVLANQGREEPDPLEAVPQASSSS
jgi:hypothetical protein